MLYPGRETDPAGAEPVTFSVGTGQTVETLGFQIISHLLQIIIRHVLISIEVTQQNQTRINILYVRGVLLAN